MILLQIFRKSPCIISDVFNELDFHGTHFFLCGSLLELPCGVGRKKTTDFYP